MDRFKGFSRGRQSRAALCLALLWSGGCGILHVDIDGDAMAPTFEKGESAMATRTVDRLDRGDIVVFKSPTDESRSLVLRIVALPGENIEMKDGTAIIDGRPLEEPYVIEANRSADSWEPRRVPDGEYFMMGDNRPHSVDSRTWGTVRRDLIWAKVLDLQATERPGA